MNKDNVIDISGLKYSQDTTEPAELMFVDPFKSYSPGQIIRKGNLWYRVESQILPALAMVRKYYPNRLPDPSKRNETARRT